MALAPGGRTGPYRWIRHLGSGSSSEVWAAERAGRFVAVKVFSGLERKRRFAEAIRRETRLGRLLEGLPGVVNVAHVLTIGGDLYLEMRWVRGPSLEQVLAGRMRAGLGPLPRSVAVAWAVQILEALAAASRRIAPSRPESFVHRDLKPANLLLEPRSGRVLVTDFGIAKAEAELGFEETASGIVKGTPRFMAPEIILEQDRDARADQFAVGAVVYELVTGRALYTGADLMEILTRACEAQVEPALAHLADAPALQEVLRRMMAREPSERFPDHLAAASALRRLVLPGPSPEELRLELLATAIDEKGDQPGPQGWGTQEGVTLLGDEEETLVDHPDQETTLVGDPASEPTWQTDAADEDDETELIDRDTIPE